MESPPPWACMDNVPHGPGLRRDVAGCADGQSPSWPRDGWSSWPGRLALTSRPTRPQPISPVDRVERLCREVGVPARLSEFGIRREQIPSLVDDLRGNSMSGNPRDLDDAELEALLVEHC